jgi:hypothetical protein
MLNNKGYEMSKELFFGRVVLQMVAKLPILHMDGLDPKMAAKNLLTINNTGPRFLVLDTRDNTIKTAFKNMVGFVEDKEMDQFYIINWQRRDTNGTALNDNYRTTAHIDTLIPYECIIELNEINLTDYLTAYKKQP